MTGARAPDDAALALGRFTAALLALRDLEAKLVRHLDELQVAQAQLDRAGIAQIELKFGRELTAALQVRRGEAFWDRSPPDPTPAALTNGGGA